MPSQYQEGGEDNPAAFFCWSHRLRIMSLAWCSQASEMCRWLIAAISAGDLS